MAAVVRKTLERVLAQAAVRRHYLEGSHSRAMHCSSFTASTASLEMALAAREDGLDGIG
jgi:hypothetical protein